MNTELRKAFSELKTKCNSSEQRKAYNNLIKTFSVPHSIKECIEKSSLKIDEVINVFDITGDPNDKSEYELTIEGKKIYLTPGPDMYLITAYKLNEDGFDTSSKINAKLIGATKFDKQLSEFLNLI